MRNIRLMKAGKLSVQRVIGSEGSPRGWQRSATAQRVSRPCSAAKSVRVKLKIQSRRRRALEAVSGGGGDNGAVEVDAGSVRAV